MAIFRNIIHFFKQSFVCEIFNNGFFLFLYFIVLNLFYCVVETKIENLETQTIKNKEI